MTRSSHHFTILVAAIAGVLGGLAATLATAGAAFATRVPDPGDASTVTSLPKLVHHGTTVWETAVVALVAAVIVGVLILVVRSSRRPSTRLAVR